ncbi:MAG: sugar porter family MFS transporter [Dysgonamonadaceae bacterium]|jgi:sugar porter (SP) family MFS transporter|nr:sugar porter family MFS transporter [Dysgonamonadaceae bacterium]
MRHTENIRYAFFLAVIAALGGFLFGYDTAVISGTTEDVKAFYGLSDIQQGWYVGCAILGSIAGVLLAGKLSDLFGRKRILMLSAVLFFASAVGCMIYSSFDGLGVYRIVGGVGIGVASIIAPLYISEISVPRYRGRMVSCYQLAITIGILGSYLSNAGVLKWSHAVLYDSGFMKLIVNDQVWRGMLGMEAVPAFLFLIILFFIPESPRWLVVKQKDIPALEILSKIYSQDKAQVEIREIRQLVDKDEKSDWRLLFKPGFRTALIIGVCLAILGQFMGVNAVFYYGPKFLSEAGLEKTASLDLQVWVGLVNVFSTVLAMFVIDRIGRKKLIYIGVSGMVVLLGCIGLFFYGISQGMDIPTGVLFGLILAYVFSSAISISAVIFVLLSEMYPVKVRGAAMSIAGFSLWVGTYLIGQLTPWLTTRLSAYGVFWLFGVMCVPYLLITCFLVPETTGKSLEEIERMWEEKGRKHKQ